MLRAATYLGELDRNYALALFAPTPPAATRAAGPAGDPVATEVWVDVTVHDGRKPLFAGCATAPALAGMGPIAAALLILRRRSRR